MKNLSVVIGTIVRPLGYAGSGRNFRKVVSDIALVLTIQKSRSSGHAYVNLGAQPMGIPMGSNRMVDPTRLTEVDCVFRCRVDKDWPLLVPTDEVPRHTRVIEDDVKAFETKVFEMRDLSRRGCGAELFRSRHFMGPAPRAALTLAQLLATDGHPEPARTLANHALEIAGGATLLRADIEHFLAALDH